MTARLRKLALTKAGWAQGDKNKRTDSWQKDPMHFLRETNWLKTNVNRD